MAKNKDKKGKKGKNGNQGFNTENFEERGFPVIPIGTYLAGISATEWKANAAGTGHYMTCTLTVLKGEEKGFKKMIFLNLDHPNEKAVKMATGELKELVNTIYGKDMNITVDKMPKIFNGKKVKMKLGIDKDGSNKILEYLPAKGKSKGDDDFSDAPF